MKTVLVKFRQLLGNMYCSIWTLEDLNSELLPQGPQFFSARYNVMSHKAGLPSCDYSHLNAMDNRASDFLLTT